MKEYTFFSLVAAGFLLALDHRLGTRLFWRREFWIFMSIMTLCQILVNGYLTSRPVFLYGEAFISGLRVGTIPIEDFIFGFDFISLVVILWEYFKKRGLGAAC